MVQQDLQGLLGQLDHQVTAEHLVCLDLLVLLVHVDHKEPREKEEILARPEKKGPMDHKACQVQLALLVQEASVERKDRLESLGLLDLEADQETKVPLVLLAPWDHQEDLACQ